MKMSLQNRIACFPYEHNVFCGTISQKKFTDKTEVGIRWAFYNISILMYFCELVKGLWGFFQYLFSKSDAHIKKVLIII